MQRYGQPDPNCVYGLEQDDKGPWVRYEDVVTGGAEPVVAPEGWKLVLVNEGFGGLMDSLERAHRKGYMPDAITEDYEGFDYRDAAPTAQPQPQPERTVLFDDRPQNQRIAEAEERMRNPAPLQFEDESAQPEAPAEPSGDKYAAGGLMLVLDKLLADYHAAVWNAADGTNSGIDYDMAGVDIAKAIQAHVRTMLSAALPSMPCPLCENGLMLDRRAFRCLACKGELVSREQFVANAPSADWSNRRTDTIDGWVNELLTLAEHPRRGNVPGFFIDAMRTIARGISSLATPAPVAPAEPSDKPLGYVKFRAAQTLQTDGYCDGHEWLEFCEPGEIGDDKKPAFAVYATPQATLVARQPAELTDAQIADIFREVCGVTAISVDFELARAILKAQGGSQ